MLQDQIDHNEFCSRGQKQQKSSEACAGMPETGYGASRHWPGDYVPPPFNKKSEFDAVGIAPMASNIGIADRWHRHFVTPSRPVKLSLLQDRS